METVIVMWAIWGVVPSAWVTAYVANRLRERAAVAGLTLAARYLALGFRDIYRLFRPAQPELAARRRPKGAAVIALALAVATFAASMAGIWLCADRGMGK